MTPKEAFYKVLERAEFAYIGHNDVDMVIKALNELEELKKDLARFLELMEKPFTNHFDEIEYRKLKEKLSKVGRTNE